MVLWYQTKIQRGWEHRVSVSDLPFHGLLQSIFMTRVYVISAKSNLEITEAVLSAILALVCNTTALALKPHTLLGF